MDRSLDLFPPHTVCVCVCLSAHGAVISMRKECREWTGAAFSFSEAAADAAQGHKGDLIHHVVNSPELSAHVSGHHVIKRFLTKVILGRGTWCWPFKMHSNLLNKVPNCFYYLYLFLYSFA